MKVNTKIPETDNEKVEYLINVFNLTRDEAEAVIYEPQKPKRDPLTKEELEYVKSIYPTDPRAEETQKKANEYFQKYFLRK